MVTSFDLTSCITLY